MGRSSRWPMHRSAERRDACRLLSRLGRWDAKAPKNQRKRRDARRRSRICHDCNRSFLKAAAASGSSRQRDDRAAGTPDAGHQEGGHDSKIRIDQKPECDLRRRRAQDEFRPQQTERQQQYTGECAEGMADRPRFGTAKYGTAKPSKEVNRKRSRRWLWRDSIFDGAMSSSRLVPPHSSKALGAPIGSRRRK
jgi:hypothetical protein